MYFKEKDEQTYYLWIKLYIFNMTDYLDWYWKYVVRLVNKMFPFATSIFILSTHQFVKHFRDKDNAWS